MNKIIQKCHQGFNLCCNHRAFSLIEMLMALLVASLLLAALAPVITRKLSEENVSVTNGGLLNERKVCAYINDTFEDMEKDDCIVPSDAHTGSAIIVSGGGGGSGAIDSVKSSVKTQEFKGISGATNNTTQTQYTFTFNKDIDTIQLSLTGGGGGAGGGNYTYTTGSPNNQDDCTKAGLGKTDTNNNTGTVSNPILVYDEGNGGRCITKYNQTTGVDTASNIPNCTEYNEAKYSPSNPNTYTSIPICTYSGALQACGDLTSKFFGSTSSLAFRLPSSSELEKWSKNENMYRTTNSSSIAQAGTLLLCDRSSTYYPSCPSPSTALGNQMVGSPSNVWTGTIAPNSKCTNGQGIYSMYLESNKWSKLDLYCNLYGAQWNYYNYFSTRCVIDKVPKLQTYIGGGGGASGNIIINVPKEVLTYATKNNGTGTIKIYAGAGGKGGAGGSTASGIYGSPTRVEVYAPNDATPMWVVQIFGGNCGKGASTSNNGEGAPIFSSNSTDLKNCSFRYRNIAGGIYDDEIRIACGAIPGVQNCGRTICVYNGGNGVGSDTKNSETHDCMGCGGNTAWDGVRQNLISTAQDAYNYATLPDSNGVKGGGGGGGTCSVNSSGGVDCSDGGSGGPGGVVLHYTTKSPGMGGSGGGAGALLHIVNFETRPGDTIKIKAGKRGSGGGVGAGGLDGGESSITIGSKTYTIAGGKGGKAGTAGIAPTDNISNATLPKAGNAGEGSKINTTYPGAKFNGENGTMGIAPAASDISISQGGNGGVNPKTALFADIPCGGLSKVSISGAACNRASNIPTPLTRTLTKEDFNSAFKSTYGAGASGGGGGGWNDNLNEATKASSGASGLGGYVFVYFGPW